MRILRPAKQYAGSRVRITVGARYRPPSLDRSDRAVGDFPAASRWRRIVPLLVLAGLWLLAFGSSAALKTGPGGRGMSGDLAIFLSASRALQVGGNPYDRTRLYAIERRWLQAEGLSVPEPQAFIRVANPPLAFWLLQPFTRLPFRSAAVLWMLLNICALCAGVYGVARQIGWRHPTLAVAVCLLMPQTVLAIYYGNFDCVVLASLAAGLILGRKYPLFAGLALSVGLLKPQIGVPLGLLVILFGSRRPVVSGVGLLAGGVVGGIATWALLGTATARSWLGAMTGYSDNVQVQPDISSLSGLYAYSVTGVSRTFLEVLLLCAAAAIIYAVAKHLLPGDVRSLRSVGWLWLVAFLVTPFAHFHDQVVLALPILALVGPDGLHLRQRSVVCALYLLLLEVLVFPAGRAETDYQSLVLLAVTLVSLAAVRRIPGRGATAPLLLGMRAP